MVFLVVIYGNESWTRKKTERWRNDAFQLWCWRRHLRVPWTTKNQTKSTLKEINTEYSLKDCCWSWSSNTLATWMEEPRSFHSISHWERPCCWERVRQKKKGAAENEMAGWLHQFSGYDFEQTLGECGRQRSLMCCSPWDCEESDTT